MHTPDDQERFEPLGVEPSYARLINIPHYYGDVVRILFLGGTALVLFASPLYSTVLRAEFPYEVIGALVAVTLAALTNPKSRSVLFLDAVFSMLAAVTFAMWGLTQYDEITSLAFTLRLSIAAVAFFAFYYSVKTVRAMSSGIIGKIGTAGEFEQSSDDTRDS